MEDQVHKLEEENDQIRQEIDVIRLRIAEEERRYRRWKEMAVLFHDSLWEVVSRYEPDRQEDRGKQ